MAISNQEIEQLKVHFLHKLGGVLKGTVKPDQTDTHDLGTAQQRWNVIYAKQVIADNITGQGGGGGNGGDADKVDGFHASADPQANTLLPLNALGVFPPETYHLALLTSGERALMGNLDVGDGYTVDEVDISAHVHNGQPGQGMKIDHRDLFANDSDVHPQYAKKETDEIITGNWMFTDVENRSVGWLFEPHSKIIRALPHNITFIAVPEKAEIQLGANGEIVSHVDSTNTFMRVGLNDDSVNLSGTDELYRLWIGALDPDDASFSVTKRGAMNAKEGYIGGWSILPDRLEGQYTSLYSAGELWLGDGHDNLGKKDYLVLSAIDPSGWRFWAGHSDPDYATFRVNRWGQTYLGDAFVTGQLRSTNYMSGTSGFAIYQNGKAEFNDITARGRIETVVFSERKISAISGTFYVSDAAALKQSVTDTDEVVIVDSDIFSKDDILIIKSVNTESLIEGGYASVSFTEYMKVVSAAESITEDQYRYHVVRDLAETGTHSFKVGEALVRMGNAAQAREMEILASGDTEASYGSIQPGGSGSKIEGGWLILEGTRGLGPYFAVARRRGPLYNQFDEVVRIGNLQGITPLMDGRPDNNPFYGAFVGDAAAYWAYDPDQGLRIKTRSGATAIDEFGITTDQFSIATADAIPDYTEDRAHLYLTKPTDEAPRISVKMQVSGVQMFIDRIGDMTLTDFDADNDGVIDLAENANVAPWSGITGKPSTFTPSSHTHPASDITNLPQFDPSELNARQWMGI
jgi:hypothetical protein